VSNQQDQYDEMQQNGKIPMIDRFFDVQNSFPHALGRIARRVFLLLLQVDNTR
jgi:hypothetical protein